MQHVHRRIEVEITLWSQRPPILEVELLKLYAWSHNGQTPCVKRFDIFFVLRFTIAVFAFILAGGFNNGFCDPIKVRNDIFIECI